MAKAFETRGLSPEAALSGIGSTLFGIGAEGADRLITEENNRQISNYNVAILKEAGTRDKALAEMADDPEGQLTWLDDNLEAIRTSAMAGLTRPAARAAAEEDFDEKMERWRNDIAGNARAQLEKNRVTDWEVGADEVTEDREYIGASFNERANSFDEHAEAILGHYESAPNLTDSEKRQGGRAGVQLAAENFLLRHGEETEIGNPNQFLRDREVFDLNEQDIFDPTETAKLVQAFETNQRYARNNAEALEKQALSEIQAQGAKFAGQGDFAGAQRLYNDNIESIGIAAHGTLSANLKKTSAFFGDTGINYNEVTHKPSVKADLRRQIVAGTLKDDAFIWQRVGFNGISESDAALLSKMIPEGGTAKDFRDTSSAKTLTDRIDAATELFEPGFGPDSLAKEQGLRWFEDWAEQHRDATQRETDEQALRIFDKVKRAGIEGTLPTTADELRALRIQAEEKTNRDIMQRVWEQMTKEERIIALQALKQGKTPKEIIDFFEAHK